MSEGTAALRRKIGGATDLQAVVRTMKALAASNVSQYERAVNALADYHRAVQLGLGVCFRKTPGAASPLAGNPRRREARIGAVVFGSDQGLVGRFNEVVTDFALQALQARSTAPRVWAVGERVHARLTEAGITPLGLFPVPGSVAAITQLVSRVLVERESRSELVALHLFYNRPNADASYTAVEHRLLPLDETWRREIERPAWPSNMVPEVMGSDTSATLRALVGEHLFISLFRACAESLASENTSRLVAMDRADKNIDQLLEQLRDNFHGLRQSGIDEELFDVIAGFESLSKEEVQPNHPTVRRGNA